MRCVSRFVLARRIRGDMAEEVFMPWISWEMLRFKMTTRQLIELAVQLGVDILDIPLNTRRKRRIAERLWERRYG